MTSSTTVCFNVANICITVTAATTNPSTGLELARLADLPDDVLKEGRRIAEGLQDLQDRQQQDSRTNKVAIRRKALLRVLCHARKP